MSAAELVASKKHILLDFDGPVCAAFAGYGAANISRQLAIMIAQGGEEVPAELINSPDPFELLRYTATLGDLDLLADVDSEFRRLEAQAVRIAPPTPHAAEVIVALADAGHTITIVSNNSTRAVESYAITHNLIGRLAGFSCRTDPDPSTMKPNPRLLFEALAQRASRPHDAVMIGDSSSDVMAAHAAGTASVAYVNKPNKRQSIESARPDAIVSSMHELLI